MARLRNIHIHTVLISFIHKHIFTQRFTLRWFLAVHHLELFSLDLSSKSKKSTISYEHSVCPLLLSFCLCIDPPPPSNTNHHRRRETEILNSPVLYSNLRSSQSSHSLSLSLSPPCGIITEKKKKEKKEIIHVTPVLWIYEHHHWLACSQFRPFLFATILITHFHYYTFSCMACINFYYTCRRGGDSFSRLENIRQKNLFEQMMRRVIAQKKKKKKGKITLN